MAATDSYREWAPPAAWRRMVACLWEQKVVTPTSHRVVPDGCADVIVFDAGAIAVGLADGAAVHDLAAGSSCIGLRLRPEAVATFFGLPAHELRNLELPLDDVVGSRRARAVVDAILGGATDRHLELEPPRQVHEALRLLARLPVDRTADALGLSSRQLRRLVLANTGVGPKVFQRVARLQRFLGDDGPLAATAAAAGYADQAHLTREVTRLCGIPPAELRAERHR